MNKAELIENIDILIEKCATLQEEVDFSKRTIDSLFHILADIREKSGLGIKPMLSELADEIGKLREERDTALGAMKAQDERERQAGIKCGVPYEQHGCDWPDAVANALADKQSEIHDMHLLLKEMEEIAIRNYERYEIVIKTLTKGSD